MTSQEDIFFNMISEIADYAILFMNEEGIIQNWNTGAEKIKGYRAEEVIGKNFRIFYTENDKRQGKPDFLIDTAKRTGRAGDEGWRVRKDGSKFWGSITITSVHNPAGQVIGFTKVTRDLTELKKSENALLKYTKELENKNRELEQFAYIASHDLQEPLRTISSLTGLLTEEYSSQIDTNGQKMLQYLTEASGRMRDLIKGLLDYSRIGRESNLVAVDCNKIIKEVEQDLLSSITDSGAVIRADKLPVVNGYELELRLLFQNLLSNALKFRKSDTTPLINVSATEENGTWKFEVKDNGIGIANEFRQKIFIIFQRLHDKKLYEGTGIGLAHCRKIAELHKGSIWVESKIEEGSTFYFTINT